ncbi:hypothetical protein ACO2FJ_09820 [Staphylococcus warneri]
MKFKILSIKSIKHNIALNGERNLEDAKRNATNTINNSPDLNNAQKRCIKSSSI